MRTVLLYALLALASLGVAGGTFLLVASPADVLSDRLAAHVLAHTGQQISVRGGVSLAFFPAPGVVLHDVELSAPARAAGRPTVLVRQVEAYAGWRELLRGRLAAHTLVLKRPVIDLVVDADGHRNWEFAELGQPRPVRLAQALPRFGDKNAIPPELHEALRQSLSQGRSGTSARGRLGGPALREVQVMDGTIRYGDLRVGSKYEIAGVQLRLGIGPRREPVRLSGSLAWGGEKVAIDGEARPLGKHAAKVALRLDAKSLAATWEGRVALAPELEVEGRLAARAPTATALTSWLGQPATSGDDAVALEGALLASASGFALENARIEIGGAMAQGTIGVDIARDRPLVKADLKLAKLDLDRLRPGSAAANGGAGPPGGSIGGLLRRTQDEGVPPGDSTTQVRGYERQAGKPWSRKAIDLAALGRVDVDARLGVERLIWRELDMTAATVRVALRDGQLQAELAEAQVYGGRGRSALKVQSDGQAAVVILNATFDGVDARSLLRDVADLAWIEGRGHLALTLAGRGASEREIVDSLSGRADVKVEDGAVIGWDVAAIAREARHGRIPALERSASAKTPFDVLSGSFALSDGVASNKDLLLTGSAVKLAGEGTIAFHDRRIDYTVQPSLVLERQGGPAAVNVPIPIRVHGHWEKPQLTPNLDDVLKDPRTAETVKQIGRKIRSGDVEGAVKGLLGDGPDAEKKAARAKKLLDRFLKQ